MKFYKTFEVFSVNNDANFAAPNWSVTNSFTGNFFKQVFRKLVYVKREGALSGITASIDKVLSREYNAYLKSRETEAVSPDNDQSIQDNDSTTTPSPVYIGVLKSVKDVELEPASISTALATLDQIHILDNDEFAEETIDIDFIDVTEYNKGKGTPMTPRDGSKPKLLGTTASGAHQQAYLLGDPKLVAQATPKRSKKVAAISDALKNAPDMKTVKRLYNQLVKEEYYLKQLLDHTNDGIANSGGDPSDPAFMQMMVDYKAIELDMEHILAMFVVIKALLMKFATKALDESMGLTNGAVRRKDWTEHDKKALTARLNMYELSEYYIKVKYLVSDGGVRKPDQARLTKSWELAENGLYKKWNFIYLIDAIKSKQSLSIEPTKVPGAKARVALDMQYQGKVNTVGSNFAAAKIFSEDKPYYFMTTGDAHTFLVKKCVFFDDRYLFRIIGELGSDPKDATVVIMATSYERISGISDGGMTISCANENNKSFPLIMLNGHRVYSTVPDKHGDVKHVVYRGLGLTHIDDNALAEGFIKNSKNVTIDIKKVSTVVEKSLLAILEKTKLVK